MALYKYVYIHHFRAENCFRELSRQNRFFYAFYFLSQELGRNRRTGKTRNAAYGRRLIVPCHVTSDHVTSDVLSRQAGGSAGVGRGLGTAELLQDHLGEQRRDSWHDDVELLRPVCQDVCR